MDSTARAAVFERHRAAQAAHEGGTHGNVARSQRGCRGVESSGASSSIFFDAVSVTGSLMRTALLALALSPALAVVPCSSDKPDDVDTEGCYGWSRLPGNILKDQIRDRSHRHHNALMADITRAMSGRQKSPSNPPSNPSSFKKLNSTTDDL